MQQHDIATLRGAEFGQALFERFRIGFAPLGRKHNAYSPYFAGLLGSGTRQPRQRSTANYANEFAPPHSMTSSARARIAGGTVSPSALAVLRLTTSSNLVGCWTGKSAGFAPLRIFPM